MVSKLTSQGTTFSTFNIPVPKGSTRDSASASRCKMLSTIVMSRG